MILTSMPKCGLIKKTENNMLKKRLAGFEKLRSSIMESAVTDLKKLAPEYVKAFRVALAQSKDPEQALNAMSGMQTSHQFKKWRKMCVDLIDVDLQMHRLKNNLVLINSSAMPPLGQGEWVEYHYDAWAILMQGLLYRVEKFTKDIVRELIRPANMEWKTIETTTLQKVDDFRKRVKKIRDPIAHTGGAVEAIIDGYLLEMYVLIGGYGDIKHLLEPMAAYQHKWYRRLSYFSSLVFNEIDTLSERLYREVEWF